MRRLIVFSFTLSLCLFAFSSIYAQERQSPVKSPEVHDFYPIVQFLASAELEGRESGTRGGNIAASYIASMMDNLNLTPYRRNHSSGRELQDYYQKFIFYKIWNENVSIKVTGKGKKEHIFKINEDFTTNDYFEELNITSVPIYGGHGISFYNKYNITPFKTLTCRYNDFADLHLRRKILLIIGGYPGHKDTSEIAYSRFHKEAPDYSANLESWHFDEYLNNYPSSLIIVNTDLHDNNGIKIDATKIEPIYSFFEQPWASIYYIFKFNSQSTKKLGDLLGIDFRKEEKYIARHYKKRPVKLKKEIIIEANTTALDIEGINVIGILPGADTTKSIIIGAHYDHLGMRGDSIFYGADDNASGVAGVLSMAEKWSESGIKPHVNLVFACWTAEEKGLIGSDYFAKNKLKTDSILLYINMDMISRSAPDDTLQNILSIGTRKSDTTLRQDSEEINRKLVKPFNLDIWEVDGHSGSDYGSFTAINVPVMTFFSGFHDDYHSPRDTYKKTDPDKMYNVLKLVNGILLNYMDKMGK